MILRLFAFLFVFAALAACNMPTPIGETDLVDGLPLTEETRADIVEGLPRLDRPAVGRACSTEDREIALLGGLLIAVAIDAQATEPWSPAETARVRDLSNRFEALGGDLDSVSPPCQDALNAARLS